MEKYLLEDKNSKVKEDEECLLNERSIDLFQQKELRIGSDDEILAKCQKEIALFEYLLENSEYDSVIVEEEVHYSEQEKEDIIRADGVEERLVDSLRNSFENSNQHTDVLTDEKET